jgi:hypothetical protein
VLRLIVMGAAAAAAGDLRLMREVVPSALDL